MMSSRIQPTAAFVLALVLLVNTASSFSLTPFSQPVASHLSQRQHRHALFMSDEAVTESNDSNVSSQAENDESSRTVFVGNIPFEARNEDVEALFRPFGTVERVSMPQRNGRPRGFAFVVMETEETSVSAAENLNQVEFKGRVLRVTVSSADTPIASAPRVKDDAGIEKLYVGNIPFECTQEELEGLFEAYGKVHEIYLPVDQDSGLPRGFAFVSLKDCDNIEAAIEATNGMDMGGREIVVSKPVARGERKAERNPNRVKLYVGNLSFDTTPDTLEEVFSEFGEIYDVFIPTDPATGGSRGFGFVTMDKNGGYDAIDTLSGSEIDGRAIKLNEAQPKNK